MGEVRDLKEIKDKLEDAKRRQDVAVLQQVLEPLTEAVEELSSILQVAKKAKEKEIEVEPFTGKNIVESLDKLLVLLQKFKQQNIDLSPIKNIASEINTSNKAILVLLGKLNNQSNDSGNERLIKMVLDMVQKQNDFMSKGIKENDYSEHLTAISNALSNKPEDKKPLNLEFELIRPPMGGSIQKVIVTQK